MSPRAVIFDFFGVLVGGSSSQQERLAYAARRVNRDVATVASLLQHEGAPQARWAERMAELGVEEQAEQALLYQLLFGRWPPNPGVLELIEALQQRPIRLALLSNSGGSADGLRARYPVLAGFEGIFLSGERGVAKPSPRAYRNVERELGLSPKNLLLVDDSRTNINGARQRGWQVHFFVDAPSFRRELQAWSLLD